MPAVSVIMLAWNNGPYLREAVGSMLDQTMADLEVVLVDNASTDGSVDALLRERPDARLRVFRQTAHQGIPEATNFGVAQARGAWIAIMDSDDRAHPMRLELQLRAAAADPSLDVITAGAVWMDETGRTAGRFPVFHEPEEIAAYVPYHSPISHPTVLAKAAVYAAVPHRAEADLGSDYDWVARVVERFKVGGIAVPLVFYRKHPGSTSVQRAVDLQAMACAIRLAVARRRAGRAEDFAGLCTEAKQWREAPGKNLSEIYGHFARRARAEGFHLQATFHAALASRERASVGNQLRFLAYLLGAIRREPGAWREAWGGMGKGPFWIMLRRAGFPPFPRY